MTFTRKLLHAPGANVVVRKSQAVSGDERAGPSIVKPHRREPHVIEPLLGQLETVFGPDLFLRWFVVKPHALIGRSHAGKDKGQGKADRQKAFHDIPPRDYDRRFRVSPQAMNEPLTILRDRIGWQR